MSTTSNRAERIHIWRSTSTTYKSFATIAITEKAIGILLIGALKVAATSSIRKAAEDSHICGLAQIRLVACGLLAG